MGKGRRPLPTRVKVLRGNPGKRALPKNEPQPQPVGAHEEPPAWLSPFAQEEWRRVQPELVRMGLLTVVDVMALAGYCEGISSMRTAKAAKDSLLAQNGPGGLALAIQQGLLNAEREGWERAKKFAVEFGFTPASRSRVQQARPDGDEEDPFEKWLQAGGKVGSIVAGGKK